MALIAALCCLFDFNLRRFCGRSPAIILLRATSLLMSCRDNAHATFSRPDLDETLVDVNEPFVFVAISYGGLVREVKSLFTGAAATSGKIASVKTDPSALDALIDTWMQMLSYQRGVASLFEIHLQQALATSFNHRQINGGDIPNKILQTNPRGSFIRTVRPLVTRGRRGS